MRQVFKKIAVLLLFVFLGFKATAQKFSTHAVKEGETLESIARQYNVTTASILTYNKEIKTGQNLRANTILVIPADADEEAPKTDQQKVDQQVPISFISHTARKKETLYSIAKRYTITEEQIKKYNRQLYASQLQKKMELRIPKYSRVAPVKNTINEEDYERYTVTAKETRWSIANKYGITIDSLLLLNPILLKTSNYLAEGQELRLPKKSVSGVEGQETQLYTSYTVPKGVGIFRITQDFQVSSKEIMDLNPQIAEKGGLKEGMVIRLPQKKLNSGAVNTDNYNFYVVKPKQTEFSLTRKLGLSYKELLALNPDLKNGLKAGMVLKLPKDQDGSLEVRNALVLDKIDLVDSINRENRPKLMFLLPFRLDKINTDNLANTQKTIADRTDVKLSLGFYSGVLVALDSISRLGVSVDVRTFDNQLSLEKTRAILLSENLSDYDAIIGPLDDASLREVVVRASPTGVPVVAPIAVKTDLSMGNVFFSYTSDQVLRRKMLSYLEEKLEDQNIIIIADSKNIAAKDTILARFPKAKVVKVVEEAKNIGISREKLATLLSAENENWVFVESENYKLISSVTSILNSFHNAPLNAEGGRVKLQVRMFTTNKNGDFDNDVISGSHLSNLNFTYPSVYREVGDTHFIKAYQKRFGDSPDRYAVRGFDITFDLLLKLAYKKNLLEISKFIGETEYLGNKFFYEKDFRSGYFNQAAYIMSYQDMMLTEITD